MLKLTEALLAELLNPVIFDKIALLIYKGRVLCIFMNVFLCVCLYVFLLLVIDISHIQIHIYIKVIIKLQSNTLTEFPVELLAPLKLVNLDKISCKVSAISN